MVKKKYKKMPPNLLSSFVAPCTSTKQIYLTLIFFKCNKLQV